MCYYGKLLWDETNIRKSNSLKISIVIFAEGLEEDGDDGHDGFHHTELQRGLDDDISNENKWISKTKSAF